jgi:hypothetical protein
MRRARATSLVQVHVSHIFCRILILIRFIGTISDDEEQHTSDSHQLCRWDDLTASEENDILEQLALDIRSRYSKSSELTEWDLLATEPDCARPTEADPGLWHVLVEVSGHVHSLRILIHLLPCLGWL